MVVDSFFVVSMECRDVEMGFRQGELIERKLGRLALRLWPNN